MRQFGEKPSVAQESTMGPMGVKVSSHALRISRLGCAKISALARALPRGAACRHKRVASAHTRGSGGSADVIGAVVTSNNVSDAIENAKSSTCPENITDECLRAVAWAAGFGWQPTEAPHPAASYMLRDTSRATSHFRCVDTARTCKIPRGKRPL